MRPWYRYFNIILFVWDYDSESIFIKKFEDEDKAFETIVSQIKFALGYFRELSGKGKEKDSPRLEYFLKDVGLLEKWKSWKETESNDCVKPAYDCILYD